MTSCCYPNLMPFLEPFYCKMSSRHSKSNPIELNFNGTLLNSIKLNYYTSDSLWKFWLVESIQSIHNSLWTWHDKCNICSSTSAWLLSPLECSPQKQNGWMLRFCFWGWIMWKRYNKTITEFGFRMISWIIKTEVCVICRSRRLRQITQTR